MLQIIQEKVKQAVDILKEKEIDVWLTFVRETTAGGDPVLPLIYGHDLTWQSALMITKSGDCFAIVGHFEAEVARRTGAYTTVIPYHESIHDALLHTLERIYPRKIAINYSTNDVHADGLTYGMYQLLLKHLEFTPWEQRLVTAESVISALRGRKTTSEIERIKAAVLTTINIFERTYSNLKVGMTEKEIASFMHAQLDELNQLPAWDRTSCPAVNAGPDSPFGHAGPTNLSLEHGHILHIDFGVQQEGYCSDIQRVVYILSPGETKPPESVTQGFETVIRAIEAARKAMRPGISGKEVDNISRLIVTQAGYPEYKYATGHQIGRTVHDGAALLGPEWERYGDTPNYLLEEGNVFTLEPGLIVPGYGYIGLEEDVAVTKDGAEYLGEPQFNMILR